MSELAKKLIAENQRTQATFLDLGNCGLTTLPLELLDCTWLESLNLGIRYYDEEKQEWEQSKNEGEKNQIVELIGIERLAKLRILSFDNNRVADISSLEKLLNLTNLNFWQNQVSDISLLKELVNLKELVFLQNQVTDISPLKNLVNLQSLGFGANKVTDISPLKCLINLQNLFFFSNQVTDIYPLKELFNLKELNFSRNRVIDISPLQDLFNLQNLDFKSNKATDVSPLKELVNLQDLNFSQNQVTDISPLKELFNLTSLLFSHNQVTDISPLQGLFNLKVLSSWRNQVTDISPLKNLVNLRNLDFRSNQVTDISPLKELVNLQKLDFFNNYITDISPLQGVLNLQDLDFSQNQVIDISPLHGLSNLIKLYFWKNKVINISPLQELINLKELNFHSNRVIDISPLQGLFSLQKLYFSSNEVTDISPLRELPNLQDLNFSKNQVTDISPLQGIHNLQGLAFSKNQVTDISPLRELSNLQDLRFDSNRVSDISPLQGLDKLCYLVVAPNSHSLYIPQVLEDNASYLDIFAGELYKDPAFAQALLQYLLYAQQHSRAIKEAKVIFVGDPAVGKTSLIRRFLHGTFDAASKSTEKIELHHDEKRFLLDKDSPLKVHFWDFGGQEIQHSLHKLFMSERCVYVCVTQARTEDKAGESPVEYWLELIRQYGGDSPVIVVVNKCEVKENKNFKFADHKYKEQFPSILLPSVYTDSETGAGMEAFHDALQSALDSLAHLRFRLPEAHFAVKEQLQKENKDYISIERFEEICEKAGKEHGFDFQEDDTQYLASLLHDLGTVVYFKDKEYDLASKTVLDPSWISEGMYKLITSAVTKEKNGILQVHDIKAILEHDETNCGKVYTKKHEQDYILNTLKNFELTFESGQGKATTYFIPRQFLQEEPEAIRTFWKEKAGNTLIFRYQYSRSIPTEIMARLIVNLHKRIHEGMMYREGFIIKDELTWAYIKANTFDHYINITLTRNPETKFLLYWVRQEIKDIHDSFAEIKVESFIIYIHDNKEYPIDYQELLRYKEKGRMYWISAIDIEINPNTLLGEVEIPRKTLILRLIDEWSIPEAFKEIDSALEKQGSERATFSQIRSELIQGSKDFNFAHRLKVFVDANVRN